MKRRKFIKSSAAAGLAATSTMTYGNSSGVFQVEDQQIYEWRCYTMKFGGPGNQLHQYLEKALLPALNKAGVDKVGVFMELGQATPAKVYMLISYHSFEHLATVKMDLAGDEIYQKAAMAFNELPKAKQVFKRYDTHILKAFSGIPVMKTPDQEERIFELRTYEGFSDDAVSRKVKMFNEGELDIFYKTKLNPVFFGEMIAGPLMPALTYMLWFKDLEERDANWKDFIAHPDWKRMSSMEEYKDTVSNIIRVFLKPTDYSQI